MKILILQDDYPPRSAGGAGIIAFNLANGLREIGHEVFVVTVVPQKTEEGEEEIGDVKVYKLWSSYHERWRAYLGLYNPIVVSKLARIIKDISPDVVHAHNIHYHLSYHSLRQAKMCGAKVFLTAHDAMLFDYGKTEGGKISVWKQLSKFSKRYNPFRNLIIKYYLKYVDQVFAVSHALKLALKENGINNIVVVHNGIEVGEWQINESSVADFKKKNDLENKKIVLFGGRLSRSKGGEQAVRMIAEAAAKVPDITLLIVGRENAYSNEMLQLSRELGVEERIRFLGWLAGEELKVAYHASDVVSVLSLYLDPFPTIILEAMASAKPVVATCWGGAKEVVEDGKTGFVVDPRKASKLAQKVVELLLDDSEKERFGRAGLERIKTKFTLGNQLNTLLEYYV